MNNISTYPSTTVNGVYIIPGKFNVILLSFTYLSTAKQWRLCTWYRPFIRLSIRLSVNALTAEPFDLRH